MMIRSILSVLFAVSLVFASAVFAADQSGKSGDQSGSTRGEQSQADQSGATRGAQSEKIIKADDLAGKNVQDKNGNDLGEIKSVAIDITSGTSYALISIEDKLHPVPVSALKKTQDAFSLNVDKNKLAQSPTVSEDNLDQQMAQKNFSSQVHRFFGIAPPMGSGKSMKQK